MSSVSLRPRLWSRRAPGHSILAGLINRNPILLREVRARWRRLPSFAVVLIYAGVLALAVGWRYAEMRLGTPGNSLPVTSAPQVGHDLFATLVWVQTLGWMLLAPVLTATALAGEREKGTLNGLHLSCLTPGQIVWGKLLSTLSFIGLLLLAPLPIAAICFLLGGVSPAEYFAAFLLHASTATLCAALGLACSAYNHRPGVALGQSLGIVLACCVFPPVAFASPYALTIMLLNNLDANAVLWMIVVSGLYMFATWMLLNHAAKALLKPLPAPAVVKTVSQVPAFLQAPQASAHAASWYAANPHAVPGNYRRRETAAPAPRAWQRLPMPSWLRFENPVMMREVKIRLQMREGATGTNMQNSPTCWAVLAFFFAFFGLWVGFGPPDVRHMTWNCFAPMWLFGIALAAPIMGASAFTREREAGMLQPLTLTMLSRRDIVLGKLGGSLVTCAYFSLAAIPVLLPCLTGLSGPQAYGYHYDHVHTLTLTPMDGLAMLCIVGATAWFGTAWGIFLSWYCRQTWIATAGTMALLFFLWVGLPMYLGNGENGLSDFRLWHPFAALSALNSGLSGWHDILGFTFLLFGTGSLMLWRVHAALKHGAREADQTARV